MNNMVMNHGQTCSVLCCSEVPWSCKTTVAVLTPTILEPTALTLNAEQRRRRKSTLPRMFSAKDYIYILKSMPVFEARFSISDYDMMRK